jgi:predicted nucleotidyltransferase
MSFPKRLMEEHPSLGDWCVIHGFRGSIAHGTYEPNTEPNSIDDKDTMAFCVPPIDYYYGLKEFGSKGTKEIVDDPWDIVVYESRKAIRLLSQGNPNILSLLWLPKNLYIAISPGGYVLLDNRDAFVGRHVFNPFIGYAKAQFYKMEHNAHQGYMGEKRKKLVEKFGYDTKNAAHMIRILRMGIEFLHDGELNVQREDATELLAIKHGEWSLEKVKLESERLFRRAEDAYDRSTLPVKPDRERVNEIAVEVARLAR